jgi:hypothetical protein
MRLIAAVVGVLACAVPVAHAGTISVAWDPVPDDDLAGYRVYYGLTPGSHDNVRQVGTTPAAELTGLADCTTWYVAVRALDTGGLESPSDSNLVKGWPRPVVETVSPGTIEQGSTVTFTVSGINFDPGDPADPAHPAARVELSHPDLVVRDVQVQACGELLVTVEAPPAAQLGASSLTVENPDISWSNPSVHPAVFGTLAQAIEVVEAPDEDTVPPRVDSATPAAGAVDVAASVRPVVTFSETVDPSTVTTSTVQLLDASGQPVVQASGWPTTEGRLVTIRPAQELEPGASYRVLVRGGSSGVRDLASNPLASDWRMDPPFTVFEEAVDGRASVTGSSPAAGEIEVSVERMSISVTFDRDMRPLADVLNRNELQRRIGVSAFDGLLDAPQRKDSPRFENDGRTVTILLEQPLLAGGEYRTVARLADDKLVKQLAKHGLEHLALAQDWQSVPAWRTEGALRDVRFAEPLSGRDGVLATPAAPDELPPANAAVPCAAEIRVRFNRPVDPESVATGVTLRQGWRDREPEGDDDAARRRRALPPQLPGEPVALVGEPELVDGNRTVILRPAAPLVSGKVHTVVVDTGSDGVRLMTDHGGTGIGQRLPVLVLFATEVTPAAQDDSLGVAE